MGKVINFKRAGKKIARREKEKESERKRVLFGQKKPVRLRIKKEKITLKKHLDNHKTDGSSDKDEG